MRNLLIAFGSLILIALGASPAQAAPTACGFLNGQFDVAGQTYVGEAAWPGGKTQVMASLNRDCSVTFSEVGKPPRVGTWFQKNENLVIKLPDADFLGKVAADGAVSGNMVDKADRVGSFTFKAPKGGQSTTPTLSSTPTLGKACSPEKHPVVGKTFPGDVTFKSGLTFNFTVVFAANCTATYTVMGRAPETGQWSWGEDSLHFSVPGSASAFAGVFRNGYFKGFLTDGRGTGESTLYPAYIHVPTTKAYRPTTPFPCGQGATPIAGPVWEGRSDWTNGNQDAVTIVFNADCSITMDYGRPMHGTGVWRQDGAQLIINMNGGFAIMTATVAGDRIQGTMKNQGGKTGVLSLTHRR